MDEAKRELLRQAKIAACRGGTSADELWKCLEDKYMDELMALADGHSGLQGLMAELILFEITKRWMERIEDSLAPETPKGDKK